MTQKVSKSIGKRKVRRVPARGTPEYTRWHTNMVRGMRQSKLRRRASGLMTLREVAVDLCLSVKTIRRMNFPIIAAGSRCFIRRAEVERWKAETGADAA
jgi:hypothetical protein